jgi:amidase
VSRAGGSAGAASVGGARRAAAEAFVIRDAEVSATSSDWKLPDDPLGAFCRENHVALAAAEGGPLRGLCFAVKDVLHIAGARTGFGQPHWLTTHGPARETARVVRQLVEAGADMVGKTVTDELAYSLTGENVHYGTPVNPRDPSRVPGGSSSGSASAVAGGLVEFALGSDCGGSIRIPASYCGVLGFRPTHGRVPTHGAIPFGPSFDAVGWFATDPGVFSRVGEVLLGGDPKPFRLTRLLRAVDAFSLVERPVAEALEPVVELAAAATGQASEVQVSPVGLDDWFEVFRTLQAGEIWQSLGEWVETARPRLGAGIRERFSFAASVTRDQMAAAARQRQAIIARLDAVLGDGSVLCLPTSPRVAPPRNLPASAIEGQYRRQAMNLLCISGLGGLPQVTLPIATVSGLPLGLSLIGPRGSDRALLDLAVRIMRRA